MPRPPIRALLTGHRRGLGRGIARALLRRGIAVLGLSRGTDPLLGTGFSGQLEEVALDLADPVALQRWLAEGALAGFLAGADCALLINNAGVVSPMGSLSSQAPDAVAAAVAINVAAPLILSAAFAGASRGSADRRVLHLSSGAGRTGCPGWSVYGAGKAALDAHARAAALDDDTGLRIVSLAPGVIATDMQAEIRAVPEARFPRRQRFIDLHREGGLSDPETVGERVVAYLLAADFGGHPIADLRDPTP